MINEWQCQYRHDNDFLPCQFIDKNIDLIINIHIIQRFVSSLTIIKNQGPRRHETWNIVKLKVSNCFYQIQYDRFNSSPDSLPHDLYQDKS